MSHKFKVGQRVRQFKIGYADAKSAMGDLFEVVRLMPEDRTGEPSYRVGGAGRPGGVGGRGRPPPSPPTACARRPASA